MRIKDVLGEFGEINQAAIIAQISRMTGLKEANIKAEEIKDYITNVSNAVVYIAEDGTVVKEKKDALQIWVAIGYYDKYNEILHVGFMRTSKKKMYYKCFGVGSYHQLEKRFKEKVAEYNDILENNTDSIKEIKEILLLKEHFWDVETALKRHIEVMIAKASNDIKKEKTNQYLFNDQKDKIILNTGLLNKYAGDICLLCEVRDNGYISRYSLIQNKNELLENGFTKEDIKVMPAPIKVYDDIEQLILELEIEDIDLYDYRHLTHIFEDRIDRFPEEVKDISIDSLCKKMENSMLFNIKMCKRDFKWALPFYSPVMDKISYMLPFHINTSFMDVPEMVVVLEKRKDYYEITTVITPQDAYMNARIISNPACQWLNMEKVFRKDNAE